MSAQGEVGEALGTVSAHDSALKGAVQTTSLAKPHRKQVNGPFRADEHSNTIPKALPWADSTGPTGRKTDIWKRRCSKYRCSSCNLAQPLACALALRAGMKTDSLPPIEVSRRMRLGAPKAITATTQARTHLVQPDATRRGVHEKDRSRVRCAPRWMKSTNHSGGLTLAARRSSWFGVLVSKLGRECQAIVDESPPPRRAAHTSRTQRCTTSTPPKRRDV